MTASASGSVHPESTVAVQASGTTFDLLKKLYPPGGMIGRTGKAFYGWGALSSRGNLVTIEQLMKTTSPQRTLEVGMAFGGSTVVFAAMHQKACPHECYRHIAIDPFQSTVWDSVGKLKLEEAGLSNSVEVIEDRSSIVLPRLMSEGRQFGMIYIDGSHLFEDVFVDAYFCARLLQEGGYLLFDDSPNAHVAKVLSFIEASLPGLERQPEATLRRTVARLIGKRQLSIYRRVGVIDREWDAPFKDF